LIPFPVSVMLSYRRAPTADVRVMRSFFCAADRPFPILFPRPEGKADMARRQHAKQDATGNTTHDTQEPASTLNGLPSLGVAEGAVSYKAIINAVSDWVWETDEHHAFLFSSQRANSILGLDCESLKGKSFFDFMDEDERAALLDLYNSHAESGEPIAMAEFRMRPPAGGTVYIQTSATPVRDKNGNFRGFRGISRDITKGKLAENRLRLRMEMNRIVSAVSTRFLNLRDDEMDHEVRLALEGAARFTGADNVSLHLPPASHDDRPRCYVFPGSGSKESGAGSDILSGLCSTDIPGEDGLLILPSLSFPEASSGPVTNALYAAGFRSAILAAMTANGHLQGHMLVASRHERAWSEDEVLLTRFLAETFASTIARHKAEAVLRRTIAFEHFMAETAASFLSIKPLALRRTLENTLEGIASFLEVESATIYTFNRNMTRITSAYAWTMDGKNQPVIAEGRPLQGMTWTVSSLVDKGFIALQRTEDAPPEAAEERGLWRETGVKSVLYVPLRAGIRMLGFYGFGMRSRERSWNEDDMRLLRLSSDVFANLLSRMDAEAALTESEERYRALAVNSPDIVIRLDPVCRILYANPQVRGIADMGPEYLIGRTCRELRVPAQYCERIEKAVRGVVSDGKIRREGFEVPTRKGARHYDVMFVPEFGTSARVETVLCAAWEMTEFRQAQMELERSHQCLRALNAKVEMVREEERAALSRQLHDELASTLAGVNFELGALGGELEGEKPSGTMAPRLEEINSRVRAAMTHLSLLAKNLRPPVLEDLGMEDALRWLCENYQDLHGIAIECRCDIDRKAGRNTATRIFRIAQEALDNAATHSAATRINVSLSSSREGFELSVEDNGKGISRGKAASPKSLGIAAMRERTLSAGGRFSVMQGPAGGTVLSAFIPHKTEHAPARRNR